jgi:hypothetical protein
MPSPDRFYHEKQPEKNEMLHSQEEPLSSETTIEVEPRFEQLKNDLSSMFTIEVTSETSLRYPWVKDELYSKILEGFEDNNYFALDYMVHEKLHENGEALLTKEDLIARGIRSHQDRGRTILHRWLPPRRNYIEDLFLEAGMFTKEELEEERLNYPKQ